MIIRRARPARLALVLQHGANGGIGARDLVGLGHARCPGTGSPRSCSSSRSPSPASRSPRGRPCSTSASRAVVTQLRLRTPARAGRPQLRGAVARAGWPASSAPWPRWRSRSRCTRPAGRRSPGRRAAGRPGCRRWCSRAHVTRSAARGVPGAAVRHPAGRRTGGGPRFRRVEGLRRAPRPRPSTRSSPRRPGAGWTRWPGISAERSVFQPSCWPRCCRRTETTDLTSSHGPISRLGGNDREH